MRFTPPTLAVLSVLACLASPLTAAPASDPLPHVDPFIGVDAGGNVAPGAMVPFGLVNLGPDVAGTRATSGYATGRPYLGFSHNHSSGTGGTARYGNLLVLPQAGPLALDALAAGVAIRAESAAPGLFSATFVDSGIRAELTAAARVGVHRYTFPAAGRARVLLDVSATRNNNAAGRPPSSVCTASEARVVGDRRFEGQASFEGGWGGKNPHTVFFAAEFDRPFASTGGWQNDTVLAPVPASSDAHASDSATLSVIAPRSGLYAEFDLAAGDSVGLQVGVSYLSLDNARRNLAATRARTFDQLRADAAVSWSAFLNRIAIEGGTPDERTLFYSALYRTALMPNDVTGDVPGFAADTPQFWNFYCLWDTYHTVNPLYTLIVPDQQSRILNALLAIYDKHGWLPDSWIANDYAAIQGGTHADTLFADAFVKNLGGFDREKAYAAIRKHATTPAPDLPAPDVYWGNIKIGRFGDYHRLGYLPVVDALGGNRVSVPTSRTLEYSVNDYGVSTVARLLGHDDDAARFARQSLNGWTLWHPDHKMFWAKDAQGRWPEGFKADLHTRPYQGPFYEGTPWHYAFSMRHDVPGLITRLGGPDAFIAYLDRYFDGGFHAQDNQPTLLTPWLHAYAGGPDKTVDRVRAAMTKHYRLARRGLPGNDDAGTMSAWYVFAAMGFYPNTGQDLYLLSSPIFPRVTLALGDTGKSLVISASGLSPENKYVQSATFNGRAWDRAWFRHSDIAEGGELVLHLGPTPSAWGALTPPPALPLLP